MKIITPASNYFNKFSNAKTTANKAGGPDAAGGSGAPGVAKATGITSTLEELARMDPNSQDSPGSVSSYTRDIYKLSNSSVYAALSQAQKSGINKFLSNETDLSEVIVYMGDGNDNSEAASDLAALDMNNYEPITLDQSLAGRLFKSY